MSPTLQQKRGGINQRGIVLVITLLVMSLLLLLGSALLSLSSTETQIAFNERNGIQAFYLAEAGAERAIAELNLNSAYGGTGVTEPSLGAGTYTVTVIPVVPPPPGSFDRKQVTAFGYVPSSTASSRAMARVEVVVERGSIFNKGLFGKNNLEVKEDTVIDSYDSSKGAYGGSNTGSKGNIGSNGEIELKENVTVKGDAIAGDTLELKSGVVITGVAAEHAPPITLPPVSIPPGSGSDVKVPQGESTTLTPGSYGELEAKENRTITLAPGTYYFYGKIELKENVKFVISPAGTVTLYLTNDFEAKENVQINAGGLPGNLLIYSSGGEVELKENVTFYGAVYAPDADIEVKELKGAASDATKGVFGVLIGKKIEVKENQKIHFDEALLKQSSPSGKFKPVAGTWKEIFPSKK